MLSNAITRIGSSLGAKFVVAPPIAARQIVSGRKDWHGLQSIAQVGRQGVGSTYG